MKMVLITLTDKYNCDKRHIFKFYKNRTVYYNQSIGDVKYYTAFKQVNMKFGYNEYLEIAKKEDV